MKFWLIRLLSVVVAVFGCIGVQLAANSQSDYIQRLLILAGLYVTLSVSLNLINGITGQFSIGHAAFYQVGAYLAGFLSVHFFHTSNLPPLVWLVVTMLAAAAGAAIAGFVVGLPSLRLRGDYLAIVTLGFGEIIRIQVQNTPALGGSYGLNVEPKVKSIALVWLLAVLCIAICRNLLKTASGLPFLAVREDEVASSAMGVNVTRAKVTAFVLGSAFAGAAGALLASYEGFITPATFGMDVSFIILTMVVLGGTGSITGSIFSAIFLTLLPEYLRSLKSPSGGPLTLTGGTVVGWMVAVIVTVAILRFVYEDGGRPKSKRLVMAVGAIVVGVVVQFVASLAFNKIGALHDKQIVIGQLRMVIFAITLIVLMLLRPQGVFAHHEFSWDWVGRIFGKTKEATA
jgi:branched-chain amino acid transport system permease protein